DPGDPGEVRRAGRPRRPRYGACLRLLRNDRRARLRQADRGRPDLGGAPRRARDACLPRHGGVVRESLRLDVFSVLRGGRPVVREVSMEIPPGQVTALLGANGAGKSTLVLAVGGVLRPSSGRVLLGERELTGMRPERVRAAGVAVVPEGRRLLTDLTVQDNLRVATYALSPAYT